jgi:hypothetical protein
VKKDCLACLKACSSNQEKITGGKQQTPTKLLTLQLRKNFFSKH